MAHLASTLPEDVEEGATRSLDYGTTIVGTDSGTEVRNNRWAVPLRTYEVSYPVRQRDDPTYTTIIALYAEAEGNLHSFDFMDWADEELVAVRFDGPLRTTGVAQHLESVELTLVEVRLEPS